MSRAAVIQMNTRDDVRANLDAATRWLKQAANEDAQLAVLPENFAFMGAHEKDKLAHAEDEGRGPIQDFLSTTARTLKLWIVAGTIPLKAPDGRVFAASLVFDASGKRVARYDKIHLFDVEVPRFAKSGGLRGGTESPAKDGRAGVDKELSGRAMDGATEVKPEIYRESASIAPGALRAVTVDTPVGRLGLSVCYDLRFPELYRALVAQGAGILCVPSAFTARTGAAHWGVLLRARAIENQCHVLAPGQCGEHPGGRKTYGHSMIVDPWGTVLAQQDEGEGVAVAELSATARDELRQTFPALKHRRL